MASTKKLVKGHMIDEDGEYKTFRIDSTYHKIQSKLSEKVSVEHRKSQLRFFKESVDIIGVKSGDVSKIAKEIYNSLPDKDKLFIMSVCEKLFSSKILEESFIACSWAYNLRKEFVKDDFPTFERWIENYITNWAACDTFCNHTMGSFIDYYPEHIEELKRWTKSGNRWVRRAAAVSLIIPVKEGRFKDEVFEIADLLLDDKEDMVQKGYGWLLKVCSHNYRDEVFEFVQKRKHIMPRIALRYAIEKMPPEMKKLAMS